MRHHDAQRILAVISTCGSASSWALEGVSTQAVDIKMTCCPEVMIAALGKPGQLWAATHVALHKACAAHLMALAHCPPDQIYFTNIVVHELGRSDRWWRLLPHEPPPSLHDILDSRPLLEECKGGVNGEHGSWYGIAV